MIRSIFIILFFACSFLGAFAQNDLARVSAKIKEQIHQEASDQAVMKVVVGYLPLLQPNGSWLDIDYANKDVTKWKPSLHLERIRSFANAYITASGFYFNNSDLANAIIRALQFWYDQNPQSTNWWHNDIASPQTIGEILILLQNSTLQFPEGLKESLLERMKRGDVFKQTGANKLDVAMHMIYRACITKDGALMDTAVQQAFQPVSFTTEEGVQYDYSYQQHGPQLQISSYGLVFLAGEYKVASWVQGTSYALKGEPLRILGNYFVNTFLPTIRGQYIDFNTEGRGISRKDILQKHGLAVNGKSGSLLEIAKTVDPSNAAAIDAAIARMSKQQVPGYQVTPAHSYYWKADYTRHSRPEFNFNVRTVSSRTRRTETGNRENLLGKYLPDGSTNIQRSGGEYFNIMPIWEWDKIPGITARDYVEDQPTTIQWGEKGNMTFVGGVSDSVYGATCYEMNYDDVKAKKAWFFFDKEVLCLGTGVSSTAEESVLTTLNQCWLQGKPKVYADGTVKTFKNMLESNTARWLWHDSIGYYFHQPIHVVATTDKQKGSWARINASLPKDEIEGNVFKLWIDHGKKPLDSTYAYSVIPGVASADMEQYNAGDLMILSNTPQLQAVYSNALDMVQAVFYVSGNLTVKDVTIAVDKPCALMVKKLSSQQLIVQVADPSQKLTQVNVVLSSKSVTLPKKYTAILPKGVYAGASTIAHE